MQFVSSSRRQVLTSAGLVGAGLWLAGHGNAADQQTRGEDVTANEDLMREHGIIRRALLIYNEAARRAAQAPQTLPLPGLVQTAKLFRRFAEDYHERALEETHIFPAVRKLTGPVAKLPDTLLEQHRSGRAITDYILDAAAKPALSTTEAPRLARVMVSLNRMYEPHAAREDTELFPAWKSALGSKAYAEMGEKFEEIERRTFGGDGFDEALAQIVRIEAEFGLSDLSSVTAPPPR